VPGVYPLLTEKHDHKNENGILLTAERTLRLEEALKGPLTSTSIDLTTKKGRRVGVTRLRHPILKRAQKWPFRRCTRGAVRGHLLSPDKKAEKGTDQMCTTTTQKKNAVACVRRTNLDEKINRRECSPYLKEDIQRTKHQRPSLLHPVTEEERRITLS